MKTQGEKGGKKEDIVTSLNKKGDEGKTTQTVTNDIDFNHYSDDDEPTTNQESLIKATDNNEKNKPKGLKDLFSDEKKPANSKPNPKKPTNEGNRDRAPQGKPGDLQKPNFKSNPNRQNFDNGANANRAQTSGGLKKPDFKSNPNRQNPDLTAGTGQKPSYGLKKPEFKGAIQNSNDGAKTTKEYEINSSAYEEVEKRQFVNNKSNKDGNFVAINQSDDLYLKKLKEQGEEEHEYSTPKEGGEKKFQNNNKKNYDNNRQRGGNRDGERKNYGDYQKKKVEVDVDEDGFEIVGTEKKKEPRERKYYPKRAYNNNEGGVFKRKTKNDSDDDEKNFESALKKDGEENNDNNDENNENYEEKKEENTESQGYSEYKKQRKNMEKTDNKKHKWNDEPNEKKKEKPAEALPKPVQTSGVIKVPKNATGLKDLFGS